MLGVKEVWKEQELRKRKEENQVAAVIEPEGREQGEVVWGT
jgi:hypothetical protein